MRKMLFFAVTLLAVAGLVGPASAGPAPALTAAPTTFVCAFVTVTAANDTIRCTWDVLVGATKYSVDTIANYELGNTLGPLGVDFDFGTPINTVDIPLSAFPGDVNGDTVTDTLVSLVLRVKGLNPPGKQQFNQHNPFSSPTVTCDVATATCQ
jgi:hypothetical protein